MNKLLTLLKITIFLIFIALATNVQAQSITLMWDLHEDLNVVGYKLYTLSGNIKTEIVNIPDRGTHGYVYEVAGNDDLCFVVTAYIENGIESEPSNSACNTDNKPEVVSGMRITTVTTITTIIE